VLRPFIGAALALLIYFVIRGGFITGTALPQESASAASFINPFGIAALAGLAGLFAKQATDKLDEVFSTLFRPAQGQGDAKRKDKLGEKSAPDVISVQPMKAAKGDPNVLLTIKGTNFAQNATVRIGKVELKPKSVSPTEIAVQLTSSVTAEAGSYPLIVINPTPTGPANSNETTFLVSENGAGRSAGA
jgi:hypothetical protein